MSKVLALPQTDPYGRCGVSLTQKRLVPLAISLLFFPGMALILIASPLQNYIPSLLLSLTVAIGIAWSIASARKAIDRYKTYGPYANPSAWMEKNTPAGSRVFQTDWDDFPQLFYYNTHNMYAIGLDPTYLQL